MWATEKQTESLQLRELKRTQAQCTNMLEEKETSRKFWRLQGRWGLLENMTPTQISSFRGTAVSACFLNYSAILMSSSRPLRTTVKMESDQNQYGCRDCWDGTGLYTWRQGSPDYWMLQRSVFLHSSNTEWSHLLGTAVELCASFCMGILPG